MKRIIVFVAAVAAGALALACVSSHYRKSIAVTRDPEGNILKVVEREEVFVPNQSGYGIRFEYLEGVQVGGKARKPYK